MVVQLLRGRFTLDLGIVSLPIGWGLISRQRGAWGWAFLFVAIGLVQFIIAMVFFVFSAGPFYFSVLSERVAEMSKSTAFVASIPYLLLSVWQMYVLLHRDVQKEFSGPTTLADMKSSAGRDS
jgi:hypothetical protein